MPTSDEIKARSAIITLLPDEEKHDREAWLVSYENEAYEDQLGLKHSARVVHERVVIHIYGKSDQWEGYGGKWYDSDRIGISDDARIWKWRQELVDYTGGGSWTVLEDPTVPPGLKRDLPENAYYQRPPWAAKGESPKGYMFPDGTRATKLVENLHS